MVQEAGQDTANHHHHHHPRHRAVGSHMAKGSKLQSAPRRLPQGDDETVRDSSLCWPGGYREDSRSEQIRGDEACFGLTSRSRGDENISLGECSVSEFLSL